MKVTEIAEDWPEKNERERYWVNYIKNYKQISNTYIINYFNYFYITDRKKKKKYKYINNICTNNIIYKY